MWMLHQTEVMHLMMLLLMLMNIVGQLCSGPRRACGGTGKSGRMISHLSFVMSQCIHIVVDRHRHRDRYDRHIARAQLRARATWYQGGRLLCSLRVRRSGQCRISVSGSSNHNFTYIAKVDYLRWMNVFVGPIHF
jgi:hypothetical protein